ncbi:MAG: YlxR family protein [Thermodesulfobacteriota bacterium]
MTRTKGHIPLRTCIACGTKRPKQELQRLALSETGEIREDSGMTEIGRGAYVCNRHACRSKLKTHKRLSRVFRTEAAVRLSRELSNGG